MRAGTSAVHRCFHRLQEADPPRAVFEPLEPRLLLSDMSYVEMYVDNAGGVNGLDGADVVAISPDGKHAYVAGQFDHAVAVFSRAAATGALTWSQMV